MVGGTIPEETSRDWLLIVNSGLDVGESGCATGGDVAEEGILVGDERWLEGSLRGWEEGESDWGGHF